MNVAPDTSSPPAAPDRREAVPAPGKRPALSVSQMLAGISILVGLSVGGWLWRHPRKPQQTSSRTPLRVMSPMIPSSMNGMAGRLAMRNSRMGGPVRLSPPAPLYLANLSTRAGDYIVSVRYTLANDPQITLFTSPQQAHSKLTDLMVSLQLMATRPGALSHVHDFAARLTAIDDQGGRVETLGTIPLMRFPGGLARLVRLSVSNQTARYLRSIEGEIVLGPSVAGVQNHDGPAEQVGATRQPSPRLPDAHDDAPPASTLTFHLANVPLPTGAHVFGVTAARPLDAALMKRLPGGNDTPAENGLHLLTDGQALALRRYFPPFVPEPGLLHLPTRLALQNDVPNRFSLPLAVSAHSTPLQCTLTPQIGQGGEIRCHLALADTTGGKPVETNLSVWDNTPVVALLPTPSGNGQQLAVWLHLYLAMPPPEVIPGMATPTPFPAQAGERGGSLSGQARIRSAPFGLGYARMLVSRVDSPGKQDSPIETVVPLDSQGGFRFANLSPGIYRIELQDIKHYVNRPGEPGTLKDYLRRRYHITNTNWSNRLQENVSVRGGGEVHLLPWQLN